MDDFQDYEEISNESLEVSENSLQKIDEESQELIEFKKDVKEDFQYARMRFFSSVICNGVFKYFTSNTINFNIGCLHCETKGVTSVELICE